MSGRLVISKHKSYHVWNQENVEKVMRDERLHREKLEADAQREKDNLMEKSRETLLVSGEMQDTDPTPLSSADQELFQLFGDLDKAAAAGAARKAEKLEEEARRALLLRQNGAAPWALGEGSREKTKQTAWYEAPKTQLDGITVMGKMVRGEEAASARNRDRSRKRKLDPMEQFLYHDNGINSKHVYAESKDCDEYAINNPVNHITNTELDKKHKKNKTDRDQRDEKRKKDRKKHSRDQDRQHLHDHRSDHKAKEKVDEEKDDTQARLMDDLRRKRLDRERMEKKKTAVLLATSDIFGPPSQSR